MAPRRCREALSGTMTELLPPLNDTAFPNLPCPAPAQDAFDNVPALPLPEASATVEPLPPSNPYAATNPAPDDDGATVAVAWFEGELSFPDVSTAVTL
jgi:hypothetical protein